MDEANRHLGDAIESVSKALAEWTVQGHVEADPSLPQRYGRTWRSSWVADVQQRLASLANALALNRSEVFSGALVWSQRAFETRRGDHADLTASLRSMREVIAAELPAPVAGPAVAFLDRAASTLGDRAAAAPPPPAAEPRHRALMLQYLESALRAERRRAEEVLSGAVAAGVPVRDLYEYVVAPAQAEIGRLWQVGRISVADEHVATSIAGGALAFLRRSSPPAPPRGRRVVTTSVAGDLHALGVRMVADFFEMDGWEAIDLGANTPRAEVVSILRDRDAHLLAASAGSFSLLRSLSDLIEAVRADEGARRVPIIVGGAPFLAVPGLWRDVGADGGAASASEAVELGTRLVAERAEAG